MDDWFGCKFVWVSLCLRPKPVWIKPCLDQLKLMFWMGTNYMSEKQKECHDASCSQRKLLCCHGATIRGLCAEELWGQLTTRSRHVVKEAEVPRNINKGELIANSASLCQT